MTAFNSQELFRMELGCIQKCSPHPFACIPFHIFFTIHCLLLRCSIKLVYKDIFLNVKPLLLVCTLVTLAMFPAPCFYARFEVSHKKL